MSLSKDQTQVWCAPNGERDPCHVPRHWPVALYTAMGVLHTELQSLEIDMANFDAITPNSATRKASVLARWETQRATCAQFYDLDVYVDRQPTPETP